MSNVHVPFLVLLIIGAAAVVFFESIALKIFLKWKFLFRAPNTSVKFKRVIFVSIVANAASFVTCLIMFKTLDFLFPD